MELLNSIVGIPYAFHFVIVSGVFLGAILVFVFGFKSAEEPIFKKTKTDSKSVSKKKKTKEKKAVNGLGNSPEVKVKGTSTPKPKAKGADDKSKKSNALKDSKNINIATKADKKEQMKLEKTKKKGKENMNSQTDFSDEEGGWEQALSRKKNRKLPNGVAEGTKGNVKKVSGKGNNPKSPKTEGKKARENVNKETNMKVEKKSKGDDGQWQEAKSSKKRRKPQKET